MPAVVRSYRIALAGAALFVATAALADERQDKCKAAMNDRIQSCTTACTGRALAAVPNYKDINNNVKFGCLKGCAIGQIMQMRACVAGTDVPGADPTETNR